MKGSAYLTKKELEGFDKYKYNSEDTSPVSKYITHPFWNYVVQIFPKWVAPNVLTFTGWCLLLFIFLATSFFDPYFTSARGPENSEYHIPEIFWLLFAVAQFSAHTLDGCDGKQARRTNSSSPLGELFDHGLDSISVWLITISLYSMFGHGPHSVSLWEYYGMLLACLLGFFIAHWEKYNTGVLFLPWAYDVSQLSIALVYLGTYCFGVGIWRAVVFEGFPVNHFFRWFLYGSFVIVTLPMAIYNVFRAHWLKKGRGLSISEGFAPFISVGLLAFIFTSWALMSPSDILNQQPRLFFTAVGAVFSNITCRLIVSTMCLQACQRVNLMLYPLAVITLLVPSISTAEVEVGLLALYTAAVVFAQIHYGVCLVNELCDHLNVNCFSLKRRGQTKVHMNSASG